MPNHSTQDESRERRREQNSPQTGGSHRTEPDGGADELGVTPDNRGASHAPKR